MNCSDYSTAWVCRNCGSLITLGFDESLGGDEAGKEYCRVCDKDEDTAKAEDKSKVGVTVRGKKDRKGLMDVIAVPCKSHKTAPDLSADQHRCLPLSLCRDGLYGYQAQRDGHVASLSHSCPIISRPGSLVLYILHLCRIAGGDHVTGRVRFVRNVFPKQPDDSIALNAT